MKKQISFFALLMGMLFVVASCGHDDDYYYNHGYGYDYDHGYDYHHGYDNTHVYDDDCHGYHDHHYYHEDHNTYNYIRNGRWFLSSHTGITHCSYENYVTFSDWEVFIHDFENFKYDKGSFKYNDGHLTITYRNGDVVEYYIIKACENQLIIRSRSGEEFHYVRR